MQVSFIILSIIYISCLTPFTKSVITLGAALMASALLVTALVTQMINSWFAFILFIIYITGLLVLFTYMMSMSPNSFYTQKKNQESNSTIIITISLLYMMMKTPTLILNPMKGEKSLEKDIIQIINPTSTPLYWMIGIILLIALFMAVTICYKSAKPMRAFAE